MKFITLSSKINVDKYGNINFILDHDLNIFLRELGFNHIPIVLKKNNVDFKYLKKSSGLILAGGGDLYKYKKDKVNKIRDDYEKNFLDIIIKKINQF